MILRIEYDTRFKTFWFFTRSLSIGPILLHSDCTSSSTSGSKLGSFCQIPKQLNRKFLTSRDYPYWKPSCSSAQTTPAISTRSTVLRIIPCRNQKSISYTDAYTRFLKYKRKDVSYWKMHIKWKPRQARNNFKTMNRFHTKSSARVNMCFRITVMGSSFFLSSNPPETYQKLFSDSVLQQIQASSLNSQM